MMARRDWLALAGFIVLCVGVGMLSGLAVSTSVIDWYPTLNKPSWNPPPWLFGPVWTILYVMMGIAAFLVWRKAGGLAAMGAALVLFLLQLALNGLWSVIFFGLRSPGMAFGEVILFWFILVLTIVAFFRRSRGAGLLMLPYLAWVSFASVLNFTIWQMN